MSVFKAYAPNVEVNGQTVLSVVNGMGAMRSLGLRYLKEAGLDDVQPDQWYSQQKWLDAFKRIADEVGRNTLRSIGRSIPESARFPPQIQDIHSALASIDVAYKMNHRNGDIGHYRYTRVAGNEARVHCQNPYPSEFDEGIVEAMAKKFAGPNEHPRVALSPDAETRRDGAESCTFVVRW